MYMSFIILGLCLFTRHCYVTPSSAFPVMEDEVPDGILPNGLPGSEQSGSGADASHLNPDRTMPEGEGSFDDTTVQAENPHEEDASGSDDVVPGMGDTPILTKPPGEGNTTHETHPNHGVEPETTPLTTMTPVTEHEGLRSSPQVVTHSHDEDRGNKSDSSEEEIGQGTDVTIIQPAIVTDPTPRTEFEVTTVTSSTIRTTSLPTPEDTSPHRVYTVNPVSSTTKDPSVYVVSSASTSTPNTPITSIRPSTVRLTTKRLTIPFHPATTPKFIVIFKTSTTPAEAVNTKPLTTIKIPTTKRSTETTTITTQTLAQSTRTSTRTTETTKRITTKYTDHGRVRSTAKPTSKPHVYILMTLNMNWCEFCRLLTRFKTLVLTLVAAEANSKEVIIHDYMEQCDQCSSSVSFDRHRLTNSGGTPTGRPLNPIFFRDRPPREVSDSHFQSIPQFNSYINVKLSVSDRKSGQTDEGLTRLAYNQLTKENNIFDEKFRNKISGVTFVPVDIEGLGNPDDYGGNLSSWKQLIIIIIGSVIGVCVVLLISIGVVLGRRRTQQRTARTMRPSVVYRGRDDDDAFSINSLTLRSFRRSGRKQKSERSVKSVSAAANFAFHTEEVLSNAMTLNKLSTRSLETDYLEEELKMIPSNMPKMSALPPGAQAKNRYANVIPLESSRVVLQAEGRGRNPEYINANYVRGYAGSLKSYIATQAPLESTTADFWRMIWENQSQVIVMVMNWMEDGQRRCARYLPETDGVDSIGVYGEFEIFLTRQICNQDYIFSCLKLKNMESNLCRDVVHFQYTEFPARTNPPSSTSFLKFIQGVRPYCEASHGPPVIHCSTGTGRTGVYIALDICMQRFDDSNTVDIMNTVHRLRLDRGGSVHSVSHYAFLYKWPVGSFLTGETMVMTKHILAQALGLLINTYGLLNTSSETEDDKLSYLSLPSSVSVLVFNKPQAMLEYANMVESRGPSHASSFQSLDQV